MTSNHNYQNRAARRRSNAGPELRTSKIPLADGSASSADGGAIRLISKPEVCDRVGRTFPVIWNWMRQGKFPKARDCGGKPAWIESEINAWIAALPARAYKGPADKASA